MSIASHEQVSIVTRRLRPRDSTAASVTDRQELLAGFNQAALEAAKVLLVGAGGLGSEVGEGLVHKGVGSLILLDHDRVELSNLNRQFYFAKDIGKPKGSCLARNLAPHATCGTVLKGHALSFQDAVALQLDLNVDLVVCGVDNGATRVAVSRFFRERGLPVIFLAVDYAAEHGYVFVQEPDRACFGCLFPKSHNGRKAPCRTPAVKDILKVVAGLALYAIDSLLMKRPRNWNYRDIHLAGFAPGSECVIEKRNDCPLCGGISH